MPSNLINSSSEPSAVSRPPACWKYFTFASPSNARLAALVKPIGQQNAPVRGRQEVVLPLGHVVIVVEPLVQQLAHADKNKMVKLNGQRQPTNFIVCYAGDGSEGLHALTTEKYGQGLVQEGDRWVLLEAV